MFSKEMEALIQATLEDGRLEENEKSALVKRAQKEGIDLDELEIYINSLQQKRQRELKEKNDELDEKLEKEKKEAFGRTCPNCGKQVPPLTLKCECGYEFTKRKTVSSVQLLSEKIEKIYSSGYGDKEQKILNAITLFPVPNTKEDIIEFLALAAPNAKMKGGFFGTVPKRLVVLGILAVIILFFIYLLEPLFTLLFGLLEVGGIMVCAFEIDKDTLRWNKAATVWRAKFEQVLMKGRSLRGDSEFTQQLDYYEKLVNKG